MTKHFFSRLNMKKFVFQTDSEHEAQQMIELPRLRSAIWEFTNEMRSKGKYTDEPMIHASDVRARFYEILTEHNVNVDEF